MLGLMQNRPLLISTLVDYAATCHGDREIVSRDPDGVMHRTNYATVSERSKRLARGMEALDIGPGCPVATLAWNSFRHLELYYGVTGSGRILHTVNPRLFPEQIAYIINHAEDPYVFFDPAFVPLVEQLAPHLPLVRGWVALCEAAHMPAVQVDNLLCYEDIIAADAPDYQWPPLDEDTASTLCYTSGTTGNPKGVLYSHRSTVLHAFGACTADSFGFSARDSILVVVPMFHANAWSVPFSAALCGAKLVLPGPRLDPESVFLLLEQEACSMAGGAPTIWLNFLAWVEANGSTLDLSRLKLKRVFAGGTAPPRATIEKMRDLMGVFLLHVWGMTETSPILTISSPLAKHDAASPDRIVDMQVRQGRLMYGAELKLVDADGWFSTGDVATIDPDGYVQLTDRLKDVIKSGGEWISSIEIENLAVSQPDVFEAAVIGVHHPVWQERPLLLIQPKPGCTPSKESILAFLSSRIVKWWLPDDVLLVDSLPHTATGKLLKTELRRQYHGHLAVSG